MDTRSTSWPSDPARPLRTEAVFLDRDGVINRDSTGYITSWPQFAFLPGSLEAIRDLTAAGLKVILITNQSAVGRGLMRPATLAEMHRRLRQTVARAGGALTDIFHCPHIPKAHCRCRKPAPGLIHQARDRYRLDLARTAMIGDRALDIACGRRAGCGLTILVRSGRHAPESELQALGVDPDWIADDLSAAACWLLDRRNM